MLYSFCRNSKIRKHQMNVVKIVQASNNADPDRITYKTILNKIGSTMLSRLSGHQTVKSNKITCDICVATVKAIILQKQQDEETVR